MSAPVPAAGVGRLAPSMDPLAARMATPPCTRVQFALVHSSRESTCRIVGLVQRCCVYAWRPAPVVSWPTLPPPRWALRLRGVEPRAVLGVSVLDGQGVVYDLASTVGRNGQTATAGEMIVAMAALRGRTGLWIDASDLIDLKPADKVSVVLHLRAPVCATQVCIEPVLQPPQPAA